MWGLSKAAGKVHDDLDSFKAEAEATDDFETLGAINKRLCEYARKNCFRGLSDHAREVNIFIVTKANTIRKLTLLKS